MYLNCYLVWNGSSSPSRYSNCSGFQTRNSSLGRRINSLTANIEHDILYNHQHPFYYSSSFAGRAWREELHQVMLSRHLNMASIVTLRAYLRHYKFLGSISSYNKSDSQFSIFKSCTIMFWYELPLMSLKNRRRTSCSQYPHRSIPANHSAGPFKEINPVNTYKGTTCA